jgi:LPXTG-motif cell wall-anchored protein
VVPEVEVLPQVVTAPTETQPQLAFTGSDNKPLLLVGGVLLLLGLSLVAVDRVGLVRKGRHSR